MHINLNTDVTSQDDESKAEASSDEQGCSSVMGLLNNLTSVLKNSGVQIPKRDKLLNNFMKFFKEHLKQDFINHCPEFESATNEVRVKNFEYWLTSYAQNLFGHEVFNNLRNEEYYGKWKGLQFTLGSFICKNTMKQLITSSREKAYFYGLQKCLKSCSQKKLAIILKNEYLVRILEHMFETDKVNPILDKAF